MKQILMALAMTVAAVTAQPEFYPFDVTIGGAKAEVKEHNGQFAEVAQPAAAAATVSIDSATPLLVVNVYLCKADGSVDFDNEPTGTWFAKESKEVRLGSSFSQQPVKSGTYLAIVSAGGKNARVAFRVDTAENKEPVDFSKLLAFLKKKAEAKSAAPAK